MFFLGILGAEINATRKELRPHWHSRRFVNESWLNEEEHGKMVFDMRSLDQDRLLQLWRTNKNSMQNAITNRRTTIK